MLGHTQAQTTLRYAHLDSDKVGEAASTVAAHIDAAVEGGLSSPHGGPDGVGDGKKTVGAAS